MKFPAHRPQAVTSISTVATFDNNFYSRLRAEATRVASMKLITDTGCQFRPPYIVLVTKKIVNL
jgi:hypothetical protein